MHNRRYFFKKNERLCLRKDMENVIHNGKKFLTYPFLVNYVIKDAQDNETSKIAISVAKRNFKKAVDRNLLKRRIREAYRHHKHGYVEIARKTDKVVNAIIIYVPKEKLSYGEIEKGIVKALENLSKNIKNDSNISVHSAD
ncbi:MAG: ribonuclease P protein component [Prevotellaceae bacterium]|jgi:ribonuclease P protein component|nr:ribonuclease P protein component [Prevotellaceae bacterium]